MNDFPGFLHQTTNLLPYFFRSDCDAIAAPFPILRAVVDNALQMCFHCATGLLSKPSPFQHQVVSSIASSKMAFTAWADAGKR